MLEKHMMKCLINIVGKDKKNSSFTKIDIEIDGKYERTYWTREIVPNNMIFFLLN